ncbi:hypothetical protein LTR66_010699 [Elasticomyces elasticus]|nr:hypothetical protein LTR66_010699 [Elasticomyces elasticus]
MRCQSITANRPIQVSLHAVSPAFTAVTARHAFARPEQPNQPTAPPAPPKSQWSPEVRAYVQRAFSPDNEIEGISLEEVTQRLKDIINGAAADGTLNTINWATQALPQVLMQQERASLSAQVRRAPNPVVVSWPSSNVSEVTAGHQSGVTSRKRKSVEIDNGPHVGGRSPPWRKPNGRNGLEDRLSSAEPGQTKLDKRQKKIKNDAALAGKGLSKLPAHLDKRKQRFDNGLSSHFATSRDDTPIPDVDNGPVVGTCQRLEKSYFRLTSAPKPEEVRPQSVLERTFELLKAKWRQENNYGYVCDQFKSMRQDLTVQHIRNEFTINVYEVHARIALEKADLGEYNQCQTQLRALYKHTLGGHPEEFVAYRILYLLYTCNKTDMNDVLSDLTTVDKRKSAVKHALDVRSALAMGNYHKFFRLYQDAPNMGSYLMDMFIARERLAAMATYCKAYKPDVLLRYITDELGFDSDVSCAQFLVECGGGELFHNKDDNLRFATGKAGYIFEALKKDAFKRVDIKGQI